MNHPAFLRMTPQGLSKDNPISTTSLSFQERCFLRKSDSLKVSGTFCFIFWRYQIDFVFLSNPYLNVLKSQMLLIHFWLHNIIPILLKYTYIHMNYLFSLIKFDYTYMKFRGKPISVFSLIVLQLLQKLIISHGTGSIRLNGELSSTFDIYCSCVRFNSVIKQ